MEVTKSNFKESLQIISDAIKEASFLAIDGEFTGLNHSGITHTATFDTPAERYHKLVQGASDFLIIQFGLCTFSYNGTTKQYTAKPFNCYIFPRPFSRAAPDLRFACQSSSLEFLTSQGFDFNKLFREGIPYLTPKHEEKLREAIVMKQAAFSSPHFVTPNGGVASGPGTAKGPVTVPPEQEEFVDNLSKQLDKFVESGEQDELSLPPCSAFQRKLTYQTIQTKFGSELLGQSKTGEKKERYIVVTRVKNDSDMKRMVEDKQAKELAELDAAVGFTNVIKMISQSGKLVLGHNMLLDITHTLHQFMYPLPPEYSEFKTLCSSIFPRLLDTKLMANTQPFKDRICSSALGDLHKFTQYDPFQKPDVVLAKNFDNRYLESEALHEAGYDAYITGCCFIAMANFLGKCQNPPADRVPPTSPLLEPFLNKIFLMRSLDIPYLDLAAPDLNPPRDHVFHISFPEDWKATDINMLFSPFGSVYISWLDDSSALVSLYNKSEASSVLKSLCKKGSAFRLMSYDDYKNLYSWNLGAASSEPPAHGHPGTVSTTHHGPHPPHGHHHRHSLPQPASRYRWTPQGSQQAGDPHPVRRELGGQQDPSPDKAPIVAKDEFPELMLEQRGKQKRSLSPTHRGTETSAKKMKALNVEAPPFQSRTTPNTTPEKAEEIKWPAVAAEPVKQSYADIVQKSSAKKTQMFAEPSDW